MNPGFICTASGLASLLHKDLPSTCFYLCLFLCSFVCPSAWHSTMLAVTLLGKTVKGSEVQLQVLLLLTRIMHHAGAQHMAGDAGWRTSLGLAGVPALILTIGALVLPETTNRLIERPRLKGAHRAPVGCALLLVCRGRLDLTRGCCQHVLLCWCQWHFLLPLQARSALRRIRGTDDIDAELEDITAAAAAGSLVRFLSSLGPIALQHLEPAQAVESLQVEN